VTNSKKKMSRLKTNNTHVTHVYNKHTRTHTDTKGKNVNTIQRKIGTKSNNTI